MTQPSSEAPSTAKPARPSRRANAEEMGKKQREISVSEFFTKNRHLLGFDNPAKALLTTVKEAVDNSLDACEEAGILPKIQVILEEVSEERFRVIIEDNGPGIVKKQIPKIFGKLLYGSKFHRMKQGRGQQGIGISAAGMYGHMTTGKPIVITSKIEPKKPAHQFTLVLDTRKNEPEIISDRELEWAPDHGTRVEIELAGSYKGGRRSVDEYLEQTAIANPHAELIYVPPKGRGPLHLERVTEMLPPEAMEIKPHPYGVELGMLIKLLKESKNRTLSGALQEEFSRVTSKVAAEICETANIDGKTKPAQLTSVEVDRLFKAIPKVKILAPPLNCVVPIGEDLIRKGLEREITAELYVSVTRPPVVYRGNPFVIEVGLAYGGSLRTQESDGEEQEVLLQGQNRDREEGPITLIRFANRVPLQYQQSACAIFRAVVEMNWKQYGLAQPRGSLPIGPMVLLVHMASVWVPFTSESKEAIAHYQEIIKEIKLGLRDCGRKLARHLRHQQAARLQARRRNIFEIYTSELAHSLAKLTKADEQRLRKKLSSMSDRLTIGEETLEQAGLTDDTLIEVSTETETETEADGDVHVAPIEESEVEIAASSETKSAKSRRKRAVKAEQQELPLAGDDDDEPVKPRRKRAK